MPASLCCVPLCSNRGGHSFPRDPDLRNKWIIAIRRDFWKPSEHSIVCKQHFIESDYVTKTASGTKPLTYRLKQGAVPSVFAWRKPDSKAQISRRIRAEERAVRRQSKDSPLILPDKSVHDLFTVGAEQEVVTLDSEQETPVDIITETRKDSSTQTPALVPQPTVAFFCVEKFQNNNKKMLKYTGADSYDKFRLILDSLGEAAYELDYYYHCVRNVTVENQLFLTLVKLRLHWTNSILSDMFEISETTVSSIFITWINFLYHQWKEVNIWPERDVVHFFAPSDFHRKFPKTRVVVDGTECPIKKPKPPLAQQASFSTYKNKNTIKILVGATPGGLISYVSDAYGGSASDRQIVERSSLRTACDPGDSVMADKGFNVQDIFAASDVTINIPSFFEKKNRMDGKTVQSDRTIASKRVHIERLIGLVKTFKIMKEPLTAIETNLSTEICFVCCMLANFKAGIVPKTA